ncbi:MAG: hypothetical protein RL730_386 [Actinomycetota bacterium]
MDNYIQDDLFGANLAGMRTKAKKSTELRIPPMEVSGGAEIKVVRSSRRSRSISAYREHGSIVIQVPAHLSNSKIQAVIPEMVEKVLTREAREKISDSDLFAKARALQARYLPEFQVEAASVKWRKMDERWGSCTTVDRTIRISERLNGAPDYVLDYILVHELIHLEIPDHGENFHSLLARFERSDLANAYLEGYEAGARGQ